MTDEIARAKAELRTNVRARLKNLGAPARAVEATALRARLSQQPAWRDAAGVLLFAPLPDEPDLWPLLAEALAAGKVVALPAFDSGTNAYTARQIIDPEQGVIVGRFGIREPVARAPAVPLNRLDLVLVPGIAFDASGRRLGRGKGFYDRLLAAMNGLKCGVAFDEQLVDAVPVGPMDVRLNRILTPTRWIET